MSSTTSTTTTELLVRAKDADEMDAVKRAVLARCPGVSEITINRADVTTPDAPIPEWSVLVTGSDPLHVLVHSIVGLGGGGSGVDARVVSQGAAPTPSAALPSLKRDRDEPADVGRPLLSAVCQFTEPPVLGLVRLSELTGNRTVVDVDLTVHDGSSPSAGDCCCDNSPSCAPSSVGPTGGLHFHTVAVHRSGDVSQGFASVGDRFCFGDESRSPAERLFGSLGSFQRLTSFPSTDNSDTSTGSTAPRFELVGRSERTHLSVADLIGRSLCVYGDADLAGPAGSPTLAQQPLACSVIARSAGILENKKRLCTCDGTTIWQSSNAATDATEDTEM